MRLRTSFVLAILLVGPAVAVHAGGNSVTLALRMRDPKTSELKTTPRKVDPRKIGVVIVDPWNYHWCMTWTEQAGGMTPRMNKALAGARKLGMSVLWGPTDTANMFSGWVQRQRAMAVPYVSVPQVRTAHCHWTVPYAGLGGAPNCICGPGVTCVMNYGWDGMDPRLEIAEDDLIVSGTQELYSICKARGITTLIYFGGATNICLTGKDIGLGPMYAAGLDTVFARDLAFAWTTYDPAKGYTPTTGNALAADDLERSGIPTVVFVEELRKLNLWDDSWITEPIRVTPSGTFERPYFFEKSVSVSLETPFVEGAEIRYTLDGTAPTAASARYDRALVLDETTMLHAAAFRGGKKASLVGGGYFVRLPAMPPKPDVAIDRLPSVTDLYAKNGPVYAACLWRPRIGQSYEGQSLRLRGERYAHGVGMRAPGYLRYDLKPDYRRFVALAGVDDNMLDRQLGRNIAMYPSVVFKVFLDGRLAAESPVMRISQAPWRFDVPIPPGRRQIVLACDDAGSRSPYDLGNWTEAGFLLDKSDPAFIPPSPAEVAAYKPQGPSVRYRYLCPDYNVVGGRPDEYFTKLDPVEYAEFCRSLHLDAALILFVPTEGYCAYPSKVGTPFPGLNSDWIARAIAELHKRGISAFAYVTLGWNYKYAAEHEDFMSGDTVCFNSPYADLVVAYHREILRNYPVDGIRNDIYHQAMTCRCQGCKAFYRELFGGELPSKWDYGNWRRKEEFRRATLARIVRRISEASKQVKPSVEVWQNQLNIHYNSPLEALRYVDAAYMEWGEPFGLLFHASTLKDKPVIVGKLENLPPYQMRLCMALGARGYTYIKSLHTTGLPPATESEADAFRKRNNWNSGLARQNARSREETQRMLGGFYGMIAEIQPYLEGARPVYPSAGVVFCEATRYHFKDFDRTPYSKGVLQPLAEAYLARSVPLEFVDSSSLPGEDLSRFKLLVLPETSGLKQEEIQALREYVRHGGQMLLSGKALCYDEKGLPLRDFALSEEMGLSLAKQPLPKRHEKQYGKGKFVYLASPRGTGELVQEMDSLVSSWPVIVEGPSGASNQAILTQQKSRSRWILHLISDGDYAVEINKDFAAAARIVGQYPAGGWHAVLEPTARGVRVKFRGNAKNRLLILE